MSAGKATYSARAFNSDLGGQEIPGRLTVLPEAVLFESNDANCGIPLARLQLDRDLSTRILFTDPEQPEWRISTDEESVLRDPAIQRHYRVRMQARQLRQLKEGWRNLRLAVFFVSALTILALAVWLLGSLAVTMAVNLTPAAWEQELGKTTFMELRKDLPLATDEALTNQVSRLVQKIAKALPDRKTQFRVYVVEESVPNAMALPGGIIVVCDGLLRMVDRPEQLAAVLAHEMAHVTQRHGLRSVIASAGPYYVLRLLVSDQNTLMALISNASQLIINLSHNRELEDEADRLGFQYLVWANIDPRGGAEFFQKIRGNPRREKLEAAVPLIFRSHPPTLERIQHLQALWEKQPRKTAFADLTQELGPLVRPPEKKNPLGALFE